MYAVNKHFKDMSIAVVNTALQYAKYHFCIKASNQNDQNCVLSNDLYNENVPLRQYQMQ